MKKKLGVSKGSYIEYARAIKTTKSVKELKKNQVLFYFATEPLPSIKFISTITGYPQDEINSLLLTISQKKRLPKRLSDYEINLIKYIAKGKTNLEISKIVDRSVRGIESSRAAVMKLIGVKNTAGVILYAIRHGIIKH